MKAKKGDFILYFFALIASACLFTSCASLRKAEPPVLHEDEWAMLHDDHAHYRGVIHVHSKYSGGVEGTFKGLREAVEGRELDYIIVTDTDTLKGKALMEGMHGTTLWLFGSESFTPSGHVLALDAPYYFPKDAPVEEILPALAGEGAISFIAHPFASAQLLSSSSLFPARRAWNAWEREDFTGIEIYNAADDLQRKNRPWLFMQWLSLPRRIFGYTSYSRPDEALSKWDELTQRRRVVGIAGADARDNVRLYGTSLANYDFMLGRASTYLIAKALFPDLLYDALKSGHAFIAFEERGDARSFMFHAINGRAHVIMGDEMALTRQTELRAWSPRRAHIRLFRNGTLYDELKKGQELRRSIKEAGVYRVEVNLGKKVWIISNPIYVRAE